MTGSVINSKGGNLLTIMPIILLTFLFVLIILMGILFVKKSKKRGLSKWKKVF